MEEGILETIKNKFLSAISTDGIISIKALGSILIASIAVIALILIFLMVKGRKIRKKDSKAVEFCELMSRSLYSREEDGEKIQRLINLLIEIIKANKIASKEE